MKNIILIFCTTLTISVVTSSLQAQPFDKRIKLPGKYRQIFFLPEAQKTQTDVYKLEHSGDQYRILVFGTRGGYSFKIAAEIIDTRQLVMEQNFFMNGMRYDPEEEKNPWVKNRKELNNLFRDHFGITIKSKNDFIREFKKTAKDPLLEGSLLLDKI
jgi:hypothetical protein